MRQAVNIVGLSVAPTLVLGTNGLRAVTVSVVVVVVVTGAGMHSPSFGVLAPAN
jgi:hypothetical protein